MKKIIFVALTLAVAACSPMRNPAAETTTPEKAANKTQPAQQQTAQPQTPPAPAQATN
jgi:hypothetical protein